MDIPMDNSKDNDRVDDDGTMKRTMRAVVRVDERLTAEMSLRGRLADRSESARPCSVLVGADDLRTPIESQCVSSPQMRPSVDSVGSGWASAQDP